MNRYNITVEGKVQGVFFRASAKDVADRLGITGFVRNLANGNVYIEAEGGADVLQTFLAWCSNGPSNARVSAVSYAEEIATGFKGFEIRR